MEHRIMLLILKNLGLGLIQFLVTVYNYCTAHNVPNLDNALAYWVLKALEDEIAKHIWMSILCFLVFSKPFVL